MRIEGCDVIIDVVKISVCIVVLTLRKIHLIN